jgi:Na+-transporting NADH:ubiquinone oxidoreductase subunit NqrE
MKMSMHLSFLNINFIRVTDGLCQCVVLLAFHVVEGRVERLGFNSPVTQIHCTIFYTCSQKLCVLYNV